MYAAFTAATGFALTFLAATGSGTADVVIAMVPVFSIVATAAATIAVYRMTGRRKDQAVGEVVEELHAAQTNVQRTVARSADQAAGQLRQTIRNGVTERLDALQTGQQRTEEKVDRLHARVGVLENRQSRREAAEE
jgi:flagellar motility protein MotE (MotC chaperone)